MDILWLLNWQQLFENGGYDLILAGRESIDYNGGMVPGMLAATLK